LYPVHNLNTVFEKITIFLYSIGAGSDGNFDSYLMGIPKVGDYDFITAVMLTIVLTFAATGTAIYIYMYLYLQKKFRKVMDTRPRGPL
jgi:hypothetical protein